MIPGAFLSGVLPRHLGGRLSYCLLSCDLSGHPAPSLSGPTLSWPSLPLQLALTLYHPRPVYLLFPPIKI